MTAIALTPARANLELTILEAEAKTLSSSDFYAWLKDQGLPDEVAVRLKGLAEMTAEIGGRVVQLGKVILIKLIEFVKAHPNLAIGAAIGAVFGALVSAIPWIGPLLAPFATVAGVTIFVMAGHGLDKVQMGVAQNTGKLATVQDLIEVARAFLKLVIEIFKLTLDGAQVRRA